MNPPVSSHALMVAALAVFIGWRIYRRVRRLIGRQPVRPRRLVATVILFPLLVVLVTLPGLRDPVMLESVVAGVACGIALGWFGLRLTRFEATPVGFFYRPNTVIGVAISLLFIGRLVYRFGSIYLASGNLDPSTLQTFGRSPLTVGLLGLVAAYYTTSASGVLAWYRRTRAPAAPVVDTPAVGS